MLHAGDLVLCGGTLLSSPLHELVEAATAGGFRGVSVWPHQVEASRAAGNSVADLRRRLGDAGLEISEVEPVLSWLPKGSLPDPVAALVGPAPEAFFDLAAELGATSVLAVDGLGATAERTAIVDAFAALCGAAAERALCVKLEFTPWSSIPDAAVAAEVLAGADCTNAGLMIDSWHHFRGANDLSLLASLPDGAIHGLQLNDAPRVRTCDDLMQESMHGRRLPGEGDIDLVGFLRVLDRSRPDIPVGVEVFSDVLLALPPVEAARRVGEATRRVLGSARATRLGP